MSSSQTSSTLKTSAELRRTFLDFFRQRDHAVMPSSPLVPMGDPTLLFTTAGMVQFKPYYTATGEVPYTRATSVQKCLRLTDIDNVGLTPRHDTFFEMLGNFSFGPREKGAYFKEEAIVFAWEFVTGVLGLPKERLYVSIFEGEGNLPRDDEAAALWKKVGLAAERIVPLGRADNFWGPAGGQGACGPSSEIYFDLGERRPEYLPADAFWGERPGDPGDRFMEFWNLVFPQFDAQKDGTLVPLPRPGIDTGMGIERLALIVQGRHSIFETDAFAPLVDEVFAHAANGIERKGAVLRDARIVADHVRALTFAISEGALPGNEGAGYVLRRLLRRAITRLRSRRSLAVHDEGVLARVAGRAIEAFGVHYTELRDQRARIERVLQQEEAAFVQTYESGLARLEELLASGASSIAGADAFALHDTYGFPIEITEEFARERDVTVDRDGFELAMTAQRERARAGSKFKQTAGEDREEWTDATAGKDSEFTGYDALEATDLTVRRWRRTGDEELEAVLDRTPFYAESGGQVGDRGRIEADDAVLEVTQVFKEGDHIVHHGTMRGGDASALIAAGVAGRVHAHVDARFRRPTTRHHTATHLLHAALRRTLGLHVRQAGSLVAADRLRFDYTHFEAPSAEQLATIEHLVNEWVLGNREVTWREMPIAEAKAQGAMALFGEKYGALVRMVEVGGVPDAGIEPSRELCGGTHVTRTGDIGAFILTGDSAIASGVRRIEALAGHEALRHLEAQAKLLAGVAVLLQSAPAALPEQIEKLQAENERLKKAHAEHERGGLETEMARLAESAAVATGGRWVVAELAATAGTDAVREAADRLRGRLGRGAAVLAIRNEGKLTFVAAVTDDLIAEKKLRADDLVRAVAKVTGGSGGGKPHLALAGGKDATRLPEALEEARRLLREALAG